MAQSYVDPSGQTLYIPGAYGTYAVQADTSGLAVSGTIALVGEAASGLSFSEEDSLEDNFYGPNQLADIVAKYTSGRIVDMYRNSVAPSSDPDILGAPSRFIVVKTNTGSVADSDLLTTGAVAYGTFFAKNAGEGGNLIYYTIDETAEVKPTTSSFTYIPPVGTVDGSIRVNGGSAGAFSLIANSTPAQTVTAIDAVSGVDCTGGVDRVILTVSGTLGLTASGNNVTLTRSVAWATTPTVGDTLTIPVGSIIAGGSQQNVGAYVITSATATTIVATKLSDAGKASPAPVIGTITAPLTVAPASIVAVTDAKAWSPVTITLAGSTLIEGQGKTLEINQLVTGTDLLSRTAYVLASTTAVTWISATGAPAVIVSATERSVETNVYRQFDGVSDTATAGGMIALKVGYTGTSASVVISTTSEITSAVFTVVGGSGASFTISNLADFPTIADLASFVNSKTGFSCSVGTTVLGQQPATALDEGTFTFGTTFGNQTGRIKMDAVDFYREVTANIGLVTFSDDETPATAGLPAVYAATYLTGGALGSTTDANIQSALTALEDVDLNFIVPLFSQDATADYAAGLTSTSSTYTIEAICSAVKAHCTAMSKLKTQKYRQGFCSFRGAFEDAQDLTANLADQRISLAIQDMKDLSSTGIVQFQPYEAAGKAAAMQAAAFNRSIFNKIVTCNGILTADGSFNPKNSTQLETALQSGLLVLKRYKDGSIRYVSDQTTYQKDSNFVYNSIQAIYAADLVTLTTCDRMNDYLTGKSTADVTAAMVGSCMDTIMADMLRLKLIAKSDDAPQGWKNLDVRISAPVVLISVEIKLATSIYFTRINFTVSAVQSSSSSSG